MKNKMISNLIVLLFTILLGSCGTGLPVITSTTNPVIIPAKTETAIAIDSTDITPTPGLPLITEETVINPLTGLPMQDPGLLSKRPLIVKIQNVPRESRPQWGLSLADHVYEYYIEYGDTRFAAVFYGNRPEKVGPIRSARHVDMQLIQMYSGVLLFGGAYEALLETLLAAEYGDRLIREGPNTEPAFFRFEPEGLNYLLVNTTLLDPVYKTYAIQDIQPEFTPLSFSEEPAIDGKPADVVFIRFSGSMYNRWDYNPESGRYYRSSEVVSGMDEEYAPLFDRLTGEQIAADNLVILFSRYNQVISEGEVFDNTLTGTGIAYAVRDGSIYELAWSRTNPEDLISLTFPDGTDYEYKPGNTWFSIFGSQSILEQQQRNWKFTLYMP